MSQSDLDDFVAKANARFAFAKNALWLAGVLVAASAALNVYLASRFVQYGDEIRIRHVESTNEVYLIFANGISPDYSVAVAAEGVIRPWTLEKYDGN